MTILFLQVCKDFSRVIEAQDLLEITIHLKEGMTNCSFVLLRHWVPKTKLPMVGRIVSQVIVYYHIQKPILMAISSNVSDRLNLKQHEGR